MLPTGGTTRVLPPGVATPLGLAMPILVASLFLGWQGQWLCAVALIVVLGVPHGALDVEIGRNLLRHQFGQAWFPLFALPYLTLVVLVLVAWRLAPEASLAGFLALSVWHFGSEETGEGGLPAIARGGLPIALPVLCQPAATAGVLSAIAGVPLATVPAWLLGASLAWLPLAAVWSVQTLRADRPRLLVLPLVLGAGFVALPPFTAFTLYFVAVHAPLHTSALIDHPTRAPRVRDARSAWWLAMPTTVLTVVIGATLWPFTAGEPAVRLVGVALQLLAALTLPHMLLDAWLTRREQAQATGRRWSSPTVSIPSAS